MNRMARVAAFGLAVAGWMHVVPAEAQESYTSRSLAYLEPETRIRVTATGAPVAGDFALAGSSHLYLAAHGDTLGFDYPDIHLVELSRGRHRGSTALTAGLGLLGLGIGLAVAAGEECGGYLCTARWFVIPPLFATGGLILGWGIGQAIVTEAWLPLSREYPEPTKTTFAPAAILSVRLTL